VDAIFDLSEDALDLLRGLLAVDEGRRLSVEEALRHPWFDDLEVRRGRSRTRLLSRVNMHSMLSPDSAKLSS